MREYKSYSVLEFPIGKAGLTFKIDRTNATGVSELYNKMLITSNMNTIFALIPLWIEFGKEEGLDITVSVNGKLLTLNRWLFKFYIWIFQFAYNLMGRDKYIEAYGIRRIENN